MLLSHCDEIAVTMLLYKHTKNQNILSLSVILLPFFFFLFVLRHIFNFYFPPSPSLSALGSVMSWFSFLFLPRAYFSSHLHHPPHTPTHPSLPSSSAILFSSQCLLFPPRTFQVAFSLFFSDLRGFTFFFFFFCPV